MELVVPVPQNTLGAGSRCRIVVVMAFDDAPEHPLLTAVTLTGVFDGMAEDVYVFEVPDCTLAKPTLKMYCAYVEGEAVNVIGTPLHKVSFTGDLLMDKVGVGFTKTRAVS